MLKLIPASPLRCGQLRAGRAVREGGRVQLPLRLLAGIRQHAQPHRAPLHQELCIRQGLRRSGTLPGEHTGTGADTGCC
uniref:Uncharacterized protein n=1 Tax=Oryza rufipogon TaxID=4529 RepID=A0A0E0QZ75_ORYRU